MANKKENVTNTYPKSKLYLIGGSQLLWPNFLLPSYKLVWPDIIEEDLAIPVNFCFILKSNGKYYTNQHH